MQSANNFGGPHLELYEKISRLESLSLRNVSPPDSPGGTTRQQLDVCPFCAECFSFDEERGKFLQHLILEHKFVIADVNAIADFTRYIYYWRDRLLCKSIEEFCSIIHTNSKMSDCAESERYYLLCDALPEDKALRKKLHKYKLEELLKQQEKERISMKMFSCLFCKYDNTRTEIFAHMLNSHSFYVGLPDNLVYAGKFLDLLQSKLTALKCLYCEKTFTSRPVLKEHMRKKLHKRINPNNSFYDEFYICNYLEFGKKSSSTESDEKIIEVSETEKEEGWDDWVGMTEDIHCLFCLSKYSTMNGIYEHMKDVHLFNFTELKKNLDFYAQIKLVNFIRKKNHSLTCYACDVREMTVQDLNEHYLTSRHSMAIPERKIWDQPIYYFPTFEDDAFLCSLQE